METYSNSDQNLLSLMKKNSTSDEYLPSPLRLPSESTSEQTLLSSSEIEPVCQILFEDPFDDTALEPRPFKTDIRKNIEHDPLASLWPSTKQEKDDLDLGQSWVSLLCEPIDDIEPAPCSSPWPSRLSLVQENEDSDVGKSLMSLLCDPTDSIVTRKTSSDKSDHLSNISIFCHSSKRQQRVSAHFPSSTQSARRFRPSQDRQWKVMFQKLVNFKLEHGHSCVPHSYRADLILARWVKRQRHQYKKFEDNDDSSTMTVSRIEQLNSIGFVWHSHESAWQTKFNELKAFQQRHGHCHVPSTDLKNQPLAAWIRCQRRQCRLWRSGSSSTTMTAERCDLLASVGFPFETTTH